MDYKSDIEKIVKIFEEGNIAPKEEIDRVKNMIKNETDQTRLFMIYQSMREIIVENLNENLDEKINAEFTVTKKDGTTQTFKSLSDFYSSYNRT